MTLLQQEPKKIYLGNNELKAVYLGDTKVRPSTDTRTFTISRTEQSNMSSGWTYSDDAAGLTAGDGAFDDFFGYSAVLLNTSGVETAEMKQTGGVFSGAMTTLGNITSGDNVMIKFPVRGIKMTKSGSVITLSITKELNQTGYQYYAFNRNGTTKDKFYLGAYKATKYTTGGTQYLRSYSGKSAAANAAGDGISYLALNNACTLAQKNSGYDIETWYQRQYINALYMMKYGNPQSQYVIGQGYVNGSSAQTTGATDSITTATGATDTGQTGRIKLFGLEDRWGNVYEWLNGAYFASKTVLSTSATQAFGTGYITSFDTSTNVYNTRPYTIRNIIGNNTGMFACNGDSSSNSKYYYGDVFGVQTTKYAYNVIAGGDYNDTHEAGAFYISYNTYSAASSSGGARLIYI